MVVNYLKRNLYSMKLTIAQLHIFRENQTKFDNWNSFCHFGHNSMLSSDYMDGEAFIVEDKGY